MLWSAAEPGGGFTTGTPWLPVADVPGGGVAEQERDPGSLLHLYRDLIALRHELRGPLELVDAEPGVLAYRRGDVTVEARLTDAGAPGTCTISRSGSLVASIVG
jgi:alpha-glucosidase